MVDSPSTIKQKISFKFAKLGAARYFSHHDIMRHFERGLKRAGLSVNHTKGFNPRPRMVFPHPLPLGVASKCEEIEVEFSEFYELEELMKRLSPVLQPCIDLIGMTTLKGVKKGRVVDSCTYNIESFQDMTALEGAVKEMLEATEIKAERGHGRKRRGVEIRKFIDSVMLTTNGLNIKLYHFTNGAGRADEIGQYLSQKLGLDWQGLSFTKIEMDLK